MLWQSPNRTTCCDTAARTANYAILVDAQMMMDDLPRIIWHLDDPVADPALVPLYFVARARTRSTGFAREGCLAVVERAPQ